VNKKDLRNERLMSKRKLMLLRPLMRKLKNITKGVEKVMKLKVLKEKERQKSLMLKHSRVLKLRSLMKNTQLLIFQKKLLMTSITIIMLKMRLQK